MWDHRSDPDGRVWLANETVYLDFLLRLIPARAALEAAEIQNAVQRELVDTNRDLVEQNKKLARESRISATATIVIAIGSIAALVTTVLIFVANLPSP